MKIVSISIDTVLSEPHNFNSSNHQAKTGKSPDDYHDTIARFDTRHWIRAFHPTHDTITIPQQSIGWLWEALKIGSMHRRVPKQYEDEIEELAKSLESSFPPGAPRFVRTDKTSLKTGIHGAGPYLTAKQVVESIVTCRMGHHAFDRNDDTITLYILPWIDMERDREFRVFVYNGTVTAISQQFIHQRNEWLSQLNDVDVQNVAEKLTHFVECTVVPNLGTTQVQDTFVLDSVFLGDGSIYCIEVNPFGAEYTSGSACFHWLRDGDILHGRTRSEFRFTR